MKNFEKYEKEIRKLDTYNLAIMKGSFEAVSCGFLKCEYCIFENIATCQKKKMDWLYSEYREPVVLTDDERKLCELLGRGWLTRDKDGTLCHYVDDKPKKNRSSGMWCSGTNFISINRAFPQCKFDFIKWEDEEPWSIKELIKGV